MLAAYQVRRADEVGHERIARAAVDVVRRSDLRDQPVAHHDDAVRHRECLFEIVGDVDRGHAEPVLQLAQFDAHVGAQLGVEVRERLVEQQDLRLEHEGARQRDALLLPAGELRGSALRERAHLHHAERVRDLLGDLLLALAPDAQAVRDVLEHRHVRPDRVGLEHHREAALLGRDVHALRRRIDGGAADADLARARLLQPRDGAQRRGLAAAGRTEQRQLLAGLHGKADAAHRRHRAVVDLEVRDLDVRLARVSHDALSPPLVPAKAGTQYFAKNWIPAFAGMSGACVDAGA